MKIKDIVTRIAELLEILIAMMIAFAIIVIMLRSVPEFYELIQGKMTDGTLQVILEECFNIVIGIEFVKMLVKHTPESIIEVLMMSIARGIVIERLTSVETLYSVIAVAILCATLQFIIRDSLWLSGKERTLSCKRLFRRAAVQTKPEKEKNIAETLQKKDGQSQSDSPS